MNHEEYVYNEYYCPRLMEWRSKERYKPFSEEQKFRNKEMAIIIKQFCTDWEVSGIEIAKIKKDQNFILLNKKMKLWKDRQD